MLGMIMALVSGMGTPLDIGVRGVVYTDPSNNVNYFGGETDFSADLYKDQLFVRFDLLYLLMDNNSNQYLGFGSGTGFSGPCVDGLFYFTPQKSRRYKSSLYAFGGLFVSKVASTTNYGLRLGPGFSWAMQKKGPRVFFEGGVSVSGWSTNGTSGSSNIYFGRAGLRFTVLR